MVAAQSLPSDPDSLKARCTQYAEEDLVPAAELEVYLRDCMSALSDLNSDPPEPAKATPAPASRD
jgi:hypothetical protein